MSGKSVAGSRSSGKSSAPTPTSQQTIEDYASTSPTLPEIKTFSVTAAQGSSVSTTLTHNLGTKDCVVQIIDPNGKNIVLPFTRDVDTITFYFGKVDVETIYTVLCVL